MPSRIYASSYETVILSEATSGGHERREGSRGGRTYSLESCLVTIVAP